MYVRVYVFLRVCYTYMYACTYIYMIYIQFGYHCYYLLLRLMKWKQVQNLSY